MLHIHKHTHLQIYDPPQAFRILLIPFRQTLPVQFNWTKIFQILSYKRLD